MGAAVLAVPACAGGSAPADPTSSATRSSSGTHPAAHRSSATRPASTSGERALDRAVDEIAAAHPDAQLALAHSPVGGGRVHEHGDPRDLVAWSTIKVPLALAVIRSGQGESASADIDAALTASDNDAAESLWERLGSGEAAASAVETQLERGGDQHTRVPPEVTVSGYSPFGQAHWRLRDQTRFASQLPCLAGSGTVTDAMGRVVDGQRWGLGTVDGARFKGGWGSTPEGYVVRQLGVVPGAKGDVAVALQVRTGTHEQGTAIAGELADALADHLRRLPSGRCR